MKPTANEIDAIIIQANKAELYDKRRLLFYRLEQFRGKVPKEDVPEDQLMADVRFLDQTVSPKTGPAAGIEPVVVWLMNARPLVAGKAQQDFFESLTAKYTGEAAAPPLPASEREHKEAILFGDDMLPAGYLKRGAEVARSVVRLLTPRIEKGTAVDGKAYWGTAWLLTPTLLMTNHHVFNARDEKEPDASDADWALQALATEVHFDIESENAAIQAKKIHEVIASDKALDFTVVRIDEVSDRPPLPVDSRTIDIKDGEIRPLNVIQHPNGRAKKIAIRNNLATAAIPPQVRYFTATYGGSSGSPVFSDDWHVVAIHCGSIASKVLSFQGRETAIVNLGTQMAAVFKKLPADVVQHADVRFKD
jgi:endonuclease G, mitochondrial